MSDTFHITLPEIGAATIRIADSALASFAKRQWSNCLSESGPTGESKSDADAAIAIENATLAERVSKALEGSKRLSRDIVIENGVLRVTRSIGGATAVEEITATDTTLLLRCSIRRKPGLAAIKEKLKSTYVKLHQRFYDLVLFPLFGLYALLDRYSLVHGALLRIGNKTIILAGLDGVGKSSLTLRMIEKGHYPLSDNFTLFNGRTAIGIRMPIRLAPEDATSLPVIYRDDKLKECLAESPCLGAANVDEVALVCISEDLCYRDIPLAQGDLSVTLLSNAAPEIAAANRHCAAYHYLGALIEPRTPRLADQSGLAAPRYRLLEIPRGQIADGAEVLLCKLDI